MYDIAYAAYSKNDVIRFESSSGGIFSELSKYVYSNGGYVSGAAFGDDFRTVNHIITHDFSEINKLTGSKYLQSKFKIHKQIESLLKEGKTVLCCATPCQIAGLKSYLKTDYKNLITVDFICHGTPNPKVWKNYLDWQENNYDSKVTKVNFRNKKYGWENFSIQLEFENGKEYNKPVHKDLYMKLFLYDVCLNNGCYDCRFHGVNRRSDITIGDFWGIDSVISGINDNKGISVVKINTLKGEEYFDKIKESLFYKEVTVEDAFKYNSSALKPVSKPPQVEKFNSSFENLSFSALARLFTFKSSFKYLLINNFILRLAVKIKKAIFN